MLAVNFDPFPVLETERVILRKMTDEDVNEILALRADKRVMQYIDRPMAASVDDALQFIHLVHALVEKNDGITWAMTTKDSPVLIGSIGLWRLIKEHYRAEIGYMLAPGMHRKGLMQEAMTVVLNYGFRVMKLHSVEANVNPHNKASIGLLEKSGFTREAYFKENYFYNGKFLDSCIYSLLTPER